MAASVGTSIIVAAAVDVEATDWVAAVEQAAGLLVTHGAATEGYVGRCVGLIREHGPYVVVAPGVALAHARPEDGACGLGLVLVRLRKPVAFGHRANDQVDLVFAFASPSRDAHVGLLASLARGLARGCADDLRRAATVEVVTALLQEVIDDAG